MKKNDQRYLTSLVALFISTTSLYSQTTIIKSKSGENEDPSKDWSVYLKGFIQTDVMVDFQDMSSKDGFAAPSIGFPQANSISSNFSIKQSQVGVGVKNPNSEDGLSAYVEIDFYGPNGTTAPRFRHGYIKWKKWLVGQTWSNVTDVSIFPNMFDFVGPNGTLFTRRIQVRYSTPLSKHENLSLSLEDPNTTSITLPNDSLQWKKKSLLPAFTAVYRYGNESSYIKLGGVVAPISYERRNTTQDPYSTRTMMGYTALVSGKYDLDDSNNVRFQSTYGKGYSSGNIILDGEKYDAIPNPQNNNALETLSLFNILGIYEHWWNPKWSSVAFYSYSQVGKKSFIPGNMFKSFQNAGLNIVFQPYKRLRFGIEGNYGNSQKFNLQRAHGFRLQFSSSLNF
ncbi:DcaP family trimeric outer membrane transporter [Chryseobacterium sp. CT-SW4]|uniref:DcaP family trimeric outer membrane transporter n=1 Tax=Chryseobacterium sp. SW-1 TaxID=3157343 RepID=UPI003B018DF2